jgi:GH15 family glucan-1,4-alpha-glucosidase
MAYLPIEDHGVIGDLQTVALVGRDGTIDWCCLPHFDSPSVFASILDDRKGGAFALRPEGEARMKQMYLPDSNVLVTRAYADHGIGQITDCMPIASEGQEKKLHRIVREAKCVRGEIVYDLECRPAFDYARKAHRVRAVPGGVVFDVAETYRFGMTATVPLEIDGGGVRARVRLGEGESAFFVFFAARPDSASGLLAALEHPEHALEETIAYWQRWVARCSYRGRWSEMVFRSALILKLLTFEPTGAIVASPTMGLPEAVGGPRNWDYRYTWIRDASFTLYGLMRIGYTDEARSFMGWLEDRCRELEFGTESPLKILYGIHGEHEIPETVLDHLEGYRGSRPVRLGNAAVDQLQLDIYGELLDAVYLFNKYVTPVSYDLWRIVRRLVDWVAVHWDRPDEGIWETRGGRQDFVYSRLMCWVALDRGGRMALKHSLPGDRAKWLAERDAIYDQIMTRGWNEERRAFRHHYGSNALDAANLCMPLVKFIAPDDPRMLSTIDATLASLTRDSLVHRYDPEISPDGLAGHEGTFSMCTFWLVECLARAGRLREARFLFERMLSYANHLGLYSEEIGSHGEALGNFPQAFTHMALISAAYNLDRALGERRADSRA